MATITYVDDAANAENPDTVQSLLRGLEVLEVLSRAQEPLSLSDVARLCDTSRASARRFLYTLRTLGFATETDDGFLLRPKVMELGDAFLAGSGLPRVAHPHLTSLAHEVQDTCSLTVLDGDDVVYVDRVKATRLLVVDIDVGTRIPAYITSTGRVLLAGLDEEDLTHRVSETSITPLTSMTTTSPARIMQEVDRARRQGYAIASQELDEGLRSIAVPVRDASGMVVAALNVSTHVSRTSLEKLRKGVLPHLLDTARAIGADFTERRDATASTP